MVDLFVVFCKRLRGGGISKPEPRVDGAITLSRIDFCSVSGTWCVFLVPLVAENPRPGRSKMRSKTVGPRGFLWCVDRYNGAGPDTRWGHWGTMGTGVLQLEVTNFGSKLVTLFCLAFCIWALCFLCAVIRSNNYALDHKDRQDVGPSEDWVTQNLTHSIAI